MAPAPGGQTFFKQRLGPLLDEARERRAPGGPPRAQSQELVRGRRFLIGDLAGFAAFAAAGCRWVWLVPWLLPMATWRSLIWRVRNIAEHALVGRAEADPLRQARTTRAGWLERALLAPYSVNFHSEHHLFTQVPCWRLPHAHALLQRHGATARMEIEPGCAAALRLATAAAH